VPYFLTSSITFEESRREVRKWNKGGEGQYSHLQALLFTSLETSSQIHKGPSGEKALTIRCTNSCESSHSAEFLKEAVCMQPFCHKAPVNVGDCSQKMGWKLAGAPGAEGPKFKHTCAFLCKGRVPPAPRLFCPPSYQGPVPISSAPVCSPGQRCSLPPTARTTPRMCQGLQLHAPLAQ